MPREKPTSFFRSSNERPWWHSEHIVSFRTKLQTLPTPELRATAEEIKGALNAVKLQLEAEGIELTAVSDLARKLGPVAFDADRFAAAIVEEFKVSLDNADGLVDEFDWWKSAKRFAGYTQEKHSLVTAELARRRAQDAERAIFDIKGKVSKAVILLEKTKYQEVYGLLQEIEKRLEDVGP